MAFLLRPATAFALCGVITLYRVYIIVTNGHNLFADEAQYWGWSRHLEWGYYSKPPMVAWLIALTTHFCGNSEFCIRLSSPILHMLTSLAIFGIARELYNSRLAVLSMLAYLTLPAVSFSSLLISTDPPLLFFWSVSLYCFIKALKSPFLWWWILAGIAAGLGMQSKYTMLLFLPSAMLYLALTPKYRPALGKMGFWLAAGIALLVYFPNIVWNYQHGFVSYMHTRDISQLQRQLFHPLKGLEFLLAQAALFGPVFYGIIIIGFCHAKKLLREETSRLLLCFIVPLLLLIAMLGFISKAEINWAAPVYGAATLFVVALSVQWAKSWLVCGTIALHLLTMGVIYHYDDLIQGLNMPVKASHDPSFRLRGWKEVGVQLQKQAALYPEAIMLFDDRKTMAEMLYYGGNRGFKARKWNIKEHIQDHYDLTRDIVGAKGKNFLFMTPSTNAATLFPYFHYTRRLDDIVIPLYPDYMLHYRLYYLENFKGY